VLVQFRGPGPLARAVRLQSARGVRVQLQRQRGLRGLCLARFEGRGVILHACARAALGQWPRRLRAMAAVAKVEPGE